MQGMDVGIDVLMSAGNFYIGTSILVDIFCLEERA